MARVCWLVALCGVFVVGCSSKPKPPVEPSVADSGSNEGNNDTDADVDAGSDAGTEVVDAGFKCQIDDDCEILDQALRCNDVTNECVPGHLCNGTTDCNMQEPDDYCFQGGIGCRCITESNDGGFAGVCRRRRGVCDPCTDDSHCGSENSFDPRGRCKALPGDTSGVKYCFQETAANSSCPKGMVNDNTGVCVPQSGTCDQVGCFTDKDCGAGSVCNVERQLCEPRCRWDFQSKTVASPGCPPNQTCWVDHDNLNPESLFFGAGRCRPACTSSLDCTDTSLNPNGGPALSCEQEPAPTNLARCRAKGCMDFFECPSTLTTIANSKGYCDFSDFQCKGDCRIGENPITKRPFDDCEYGFKCESVNGQNTCVQKKCYELGGASTECVAGQLCSGDDLNGDGTRDFAPAGTTMDAKGCYKAPSPPFCTRCNDHAECAPLGNISGSSFPNFCVPFQRADGSDIGKLCLIPTRDDPRLDASGIPYYYRGCPNGYQVEWVRVDTTPDEPNHRCNTNADCGPTGICGPDPRGDKVPKTDIPVKTCLCTSPGTVGGQCPQGSACRNGLSPQEVCVLTVACWPGQLALTKPVDEGGCGL